jgi:opacity protein-like surface antigen
MQWRKYGWIAAATLLAATPLVASAAEPGFYFGAGVGRASYDLDREDIDATMIFLVEEAGGLVLDGDSDLDKHDTAFNVTIGYRFNPYLAVEASYVDLGRADYKGEGLVYDDIDEELVVVDAGATAESDGFALSVLGIAPIAEKFDLYARAGVFFSDSKVRVEIDDIEVSESGNDEDFLFGFGIGWNITPNWTARLEWTRFENVGKKSDTGQTDVDVATLGVLFRL